MKMVYLSSYKKSESFFLKPGIIESDEVKIKILHDKL